MTKTVTKARQNFRGDWSATDYRRADGRDWEISTFKGTGGITCRAQAGERSRDGHGFSYGMFTDPRETLATAPGARATEKAINETHAAGLIRWDALVSEKGWNTDEAKEYKITPGQYLTVENPRTGRERREVIFKIEETNFGRIYHAVDPETLEIFPHDHIRPAGDHQGIGVFYTEGDRMEDAAQLAEIVSQANAKQAERRRIKEQAAEAARIDRAAKIEAGKPLVKIPARAVGLIIAEEHEDTSDIQTDYFASRTVQTLFLAFTFKDRNDFSEMRTAARNCPHLAHMAHAPESHENRDNYSGGNGYWLGESRYHGWQIQKRTMDLTKPAVLEMLYIAAAEGRYHCTEATAPAETPSQAPAGTVQIIDYSEKAVAVIGETKAIKDKLKALGGRFNFRLSCGPGWIFSKKKLNQLTAALNVEGTSEASRDDHEDNGRTFENLPPALNQQEDEDGEDLEEVEYFEQDEDRGGTGHGDISYSDADPGL